MPAATSRARSESSVDLTRRFFTARIIAECVIAST